MESRHIGVSIDRTPEAVYRFVAHVPNFPRWAMGLGESIREVDGEWIADGPSGRISGSRLSAPDVRLRHAGCASCSRAAAP